MIENYYKEQSILYSLFLRSKLQKTTSDPHMIINGHTWAHTAVVVRTYYYSCSSTRSHEVYTALHKDLLV